MNYKTVDDAKVVNNYWERGIIQFDTRTIVFASSLFMMGI